MRLVPVLLLASVATATMIAAPKHLVWLLGTFGAATTDAWCKALPGSRGPCGQQMDYGATQQVWSYIDAPSFVAGTPAIPNPVTQIIKVEGPRSSYTVKYETLVGPIHSSPNAPVKFAIQGRRLFLRLAGNEYKTNILAVDRP